MARFRDMRQFVRLVKDKHLEMADTKEVVEHVERAGAEFGWAPAEEIRKEFARVKKRSDRTVSDIQDDCIAFGYLRQSTKHQAGHEYTLIVTSKGRHLLLKLGLIREIFKDNSDWLNVATAFVVGILAAATPFIIYLLTTTAEHHK